MTAACQGLQTFWCPRTSPASPFSDAHLEKEWGEWEAGETLPITGHPGPAQSLLLTAHIVSCIAPVLNLNSHFSTSSLLTFGLENPLWWGLC